MHPIYGPYPSDSNQEPQVLSADRITDIGAEPVSLVDAKEKLRVTFTDDDAEITKLITRGRRFVENYCNISIVYQRIVSVVRYSCHWPLPYGPVIGIESVKDRETGQGSGPVTYVSSEQEWTVDGDEFNPHTCGSTRVTYTAGMTTVPADLIDVILEVISFLYENRGADTAVADLKNILSNADHYRKVLWI